ncbi:MAG: PAS domain-containing protein, partial [Ignavibacteriales bacterium]
MDEQLLTKNHRINNLIKYNTGQEKIAPRSVEKEAIQHRSRQDLFKELAQLRQRNRELESSLDAEISRRQEHERQLLAKEALMESEERLQALMNYNPCLVFLKDEAGNYIYLNQSYEEKFVGSKDWYGKTDFDFWSEESARLFQANDEVVMKSGQVYQYMEDSTALDGNRYCWLCYKFPFTDSKNRRYLAGIGIDATSRVNAEEALYYTKQRFQAIVENNVDFIWEMDAQGRYTYCSPQMEKLWGVKPEQMVGRSSFKLIAPEVRTNAVETFANCAASRVGITQLETFSYENDGTPIYHETSAVPFFDGNGVHRGFYGV